MFIFKLTVVDILKNQCHSVFHVQTIDNFGDLVSLVVNWVEGSVVNSTISKVAAFFAVVYSVGCIT